MFVLCSKTLWQQCDVHWSKRCHPHKKKTQYKTMTMRPFWGLKIKHLKAHNFKWQGCFFFGYYLTTSTTNWVQIFIGLLFCACVEIHQVRRLVFDNYQRCPVSLKCCKLVKKGFYCEFPFFILNVLLYGPSKLLLLCNEINLPYINWPQKVNWFDSELVIFCLCCYCDVCFVQL